MSKRSFVKGAVILSAASLLGKALSAVFKIPLDRFFIGPEGIAIYQNAYNIYNWLLAIAATGIPLAVSNLVADSSEEKAAEIRSSALWTVTSVSVLTGALLFIFAEPLAVLIAGGGSGQASASIRVMSAGVLFMGVSSAYKGYFQGRGNMLPSAVSQIADSLSKACIGLAVCAALVHKGVEIAAAGAMSGVAIGSAAGAVILLVMSRRYVSVYRKPTLSAAKRIVLLAIPVTLGTAGFSCMMMVDNFTVQNILVGSGISQSESTAMFGHLTRAFMIYNLPATLISAVTMSVAPACAEDMKNGDRALLKEHAVSSMKMLALVSAPCMIGCLGFSAQILNLLYGSSKYSELLMFTGVLMALIPFTQVVSGILQATGCVWQPIAVLGAAVVVKAALNFVLIPAMGITGAPFAAIISYAVACAALLYLFRKHMGFGLTAGIFIRPLIAALAGLLCGRGIYILMGDLWGFIVGATVMAAVYVVLAVLFGAVDKNDLRR